MFHGELQFYLCLVDYYNDNIAVAKQYTFFLIIFYWIWHQLPMEASNQQSDLTNSRELSSEKSQTKSTTRKLNRIPNTQLFKKNRDTIPTLSRDKKYRSTETIRFLKNNSQEDNTSKKALIYQEQNQQLLPKTTPTLTESHQLTLNPLRLAEQVSPKSLVFNKFGSEQKKKIRDYLVLLKDLNYQSKQQQALNYIISKIRQHIQQLQDNNAKLLQVNYFFQKEFNKLMQDKQISKRVEKCNKSYCFECRYHLEKENKWKQEKKEMNDQLSHLKSLISSPKCSNEQTTSSLSNSIVLQRSGFAASDLDQTPLKPHNQQLQQLTDMIHQKDQEYLLLLNEYNFLDSINKDLKDRHAKLMDLYKYLSIENRTLLIAKGNLAEKELECARIKGERDQFKKKIIEFHRRMQKEAGNREEQEGAEFCKNCKDQQEKGELRREESVFTLSSMSTEQHGSQLQQSQSY